MEADFHNFKRRVAEESNRADRLEDILETVTKKFATLVENLEERDRIVDHDYEKIGERLDHHHHCWEVQQEALRIALDKIHVLEAQVKSMVGKLCHCGGSEGSVIVFTASLSFRSILYFSPSTRSFQLC